MKQVLFEEFKELIPQGRYNLIGEIGVHKCSTAKQLISHFYNDSKLTYYGYDIFEGRVDKAFHKSERNGKGPCYLQVATNTLDKVVEWYPNLRYKLFQGYTQDTLRETVFDFVYIDGGHSYETVMHDYAKVKDSKVIIFDDVQMPAVAKAVHEIQDTRPITFKKSVSKHLWAAIYN